MIEFLQNFHFLRPWVLFFLLLPLLLYLKRIKFSSETSTWEAVCDKNLLDFLLVKNGNFKTFSIKKFIYTALIFATLAAAGPCWKKEEIPTFSIENPNMFVISLAQDMQLKDIPPSRLERAKFMLSDIIDNIKEGQFGLEVYSSEPYIITPFSDDIELIKNLLPQIVPNITPDNGDRLDRAISLAFERFKNAGYSSGNIILFASDIGQHFDLALKQAKDALKQNYRTYVIDTSYSGNEKLKLLAETGGGIYLNVQELSIDKLLNRINEINNERMIQTENLRSNYVDFGYYLVFIPLICLLFLFRRGLFVLFFCCYSFNAHAGFLQNNNQEGFSLFQKEQYEKAIQKFTDSVWKGISYYKQNDMENALAEFSKKNKDKVSLYNKGVVLVKLCKYEEALKTFDEVLKIDSTFADALYNRKVLVDLYEKAKEDPSVLNCNNQQQNNSNSDSNQNSKQDNTNNDQQSQSNKSDDSQNEQSDSQESSDKNDSSQENNTQEQQDTQQEDNQENKSNQQQNSDDETPDSQNDKTKTNNSGEQNNQTDNKPEKENQGSEEQQQEQEAPMANAKKGDKDDKYDEESLAIQRQYREIPEDTGGLLREFIKKEYMKDRYKNENM